MTPKERTQEYLKRNAKVTVTFTKADGSKRALKGTTHLSLIPEEHTPKGNSNRKKNDEIFHIFDMESKGWRSVRFDRVEGITNTWIL